MAQISFVTDVVKFSAESGFKWTINNFMDMTLDRDIILTSGEVGIGEHGSKWFMTVRKDRQPGLPIRNTDRPRIGLLTKFYVRDNGLDRNGTYTFKINGINGNFESAVYKCTASVKNISGSPSVLEIPIDNIFKVDTETYPLKIEASCYYNTVKTDVEEIIENENEVLDESFQESFSSTDRKPEEDKEDFDESINDEKRKKVEENCDNGEPLTVKQDHPSHLDENWFEFGSRQDHKNDKITEKPSMKNPKEPSYSSLPSSSSNKDEENCDDGEPSTTKHHPYCNTSKDMLSTSKRSIDKITKKPSRKPSYSSLASSSSNKDDEKINPFEASSSEESLSDTDDEFEDKRISDFQSPKLRLIKRIKRIYMERMRYIAETSARWLVDAVQKGKDEGLLIECCKAFAAQMTVENFPEVWEITNDLKCYQLKTFVLQFYVRNRAAINRRMSKPIDLVAEYKKMTKIKLAWNFCNKN